MFEEKWRVGVSDDRLEVTYPDGRVQKINLNDIDRIAIHTNDSGPIGSDVIWNISGGGLVIRFPMGATGENGLLEVFQRFPGFDNLEFINAMSSIENNIFILFEKTKA